MPPFSLTFTKSLQFVLILPFFLLLRGYFFQLHPHFRKKAMDRENTVVTEPSSDPGQDSGRKALQAKYDEYVFWRSSLYWHIARPILFNIVHGCFVLTAAELSTHCMTHKVTCVLTGPSVKGCWLLSQMHDPDETAVLEN